MAPMKWQAHTVPSEQPWFPSGWTLSLAALGIRQNKRFYELPLLRRKPVTPWEIKAKEFSNCNCSYGCPCQFNALPTKGFCEAVVAMEIQEGHYGAVKLD